MVPFLRIENLNKNWYAKGKIAERSRIMSLKINRQTNLEKLFDEFAIDPTNTSNNKPKDPEKDSSKKNDSQKKEK